MLTKQRYTQSMTEVVTLADYLAGEGWVLLDPIDRDNGLLHRAKKDGYIVQAHTNSELCRRIADIEQGRVKPHIESKNN